MMLAARQIVGSIGLVMCVVLLASCGKGDVQSEPKPSPSQTPSSGVSQPPSSKPSATYSSKSIPVVTAKRLNLRVGQTAHFEYFDVTVHKVRRAQSSVEGGLVFGFRTTVCYTKRHPSALPDGSTRTSVSPWKVGLMHDIKINWLSPKPYLSARWRPVYQERILQVGQCNAGWITMEINESVFLAVMGIRYAPADFNSSATWRVT